MKVVALLLVAFALVVLGTAGVYYASGVDAHGRCDDPGHAKNITSTGDPDHYGQHRDSDNDGVVCEDANAVTSQNTPEPTPTPTPAPTPTPMPTPTPSPSELAGKTPYGLMLALLPDAPALYDRDDYGDWADDDGDCQDTRQELLIERSNVQVRLSGDGCTVAGGSWTDTWSGNAVTVPGNLDLDHHVPLANAHRSGGHRWTVEQKLRFANDAANLNFTNTDFNRNLKSDKSPDQFSQEAVAAVNDRCRYAKQWIDVKVKYHLGVTEAEHATLLEWLAQCPASIDG